MTPLSVASLSIAALRIPRVLHTGVVDPVGLAQHQFGNGHDLIALALDGFDNGGQRLGDILGIIVAAYREFSSRVKRITTSGMSKPDRVRELIKNTLGTITKKEILEKCPDISQATVQRALAELLENGEIEKIGGGRYTKYTWNNE